jgi:hypothetical protein
MEDSNTNAYSPPCGAAALIVLIPRENPSAAAIKVR